MERAEQIANLSSEFLSTRFFDNIEAFREMFSSVKGQLLPGCVSVLNVLTQEAFSMQKDGLGPIKYMSITYLSSSLIAKTYDYQIALHDNNFNLSVLHPAQYWYPQCVGEFFEKECTALREYLSHKIIRFRPYEAQTALDVLFQLYSIFLSSWLKDNIRQAIAQTALFTLNTEETVTVMYGGYMDYMAPIATLRRENCP